MQSASQLLTAAAAAHSMLHAAQGSGRLHPQAHLIPHLHLSSRTLVLTMFCLD
jgi:hypothetical protein